VNAELVFTKRQDQLSPVLPLSTVPFVDAASDATVGGVPATPALPSITTVLLQGCGWTPKAMEATAASVGEFAAAHEAGVPVLVFRKSAVPLPVSSLAISALP
jgi:hypothetical protein